MRKTINVEINSFFFSALTTLNPKTEISMIRFIVLSMLMADDELSKFIYAPSTIIFHVGGIDHHSL